MSRRQKRHWAIAPEPPHERRAEPVAALGRETCAACVMGPSRRRPVGRGDAARTRPYQTTLALRWALGGLLASYWRLAQSRCFRARISLRSVGTIGGLLIVIGLALDGHARPEKAFPVFDETVCDLPTSLRDPSSPRCGTVNVLRNHDNPGAPGAGCRRRESAQQPALPNPSSISGYPGGPLTIYADHQARTSTPCRDLIPRSTGNWPIGAEPLPGPRWRVPRCQRRHRNEPER